MRVPITLFTGFLALKSLVALSVAQEADAAIETAPVLFEWSSLSSLKTLMPQFAGGMLAVRHVAGTSDTTYSLYARDGKLASRFRIDIPDAQETIGGSITPLPDGSGYAAIAIAVSGSERVATLCFIDPAGKLKKVVRVSPFLPYHITAAADGTIWAFGAGDQADDIPSSEDPVLYHFAGSGEILRKALPRRLFGQEPPFELSTELGVAVLTSADNRIILYSPHTRQLIELGFDCAILGSYVIPLPTQQRGGVNLSTPMGVAGLAVTAKGSIYARLVGGQNTGLYELDRANQRWVPLSSDLMERVRDYSLIGSQGEDLALCPTGPRGVSISVKWIRLTPRFTP